MKGSPPHVRGPHPVPHVSKSHVGITPACAGTTLQKLYTTHTCRDHPRMCGDHFAFEQSFPASKGSPPHVRGPRIYSTCHAISFGITPSFSGSTSSISVTHAQICDHPRRCGEHCW